jgi:hypothetical protein
MKPSLASSRLCRRFGKQKSFSFADAKFYAALGFGLGLRSKIRLMDFASRAHSLRDRFAQLVFRALWAAHSYG